MWDVHFIAITDIDIDTIITHKSSGGRFVTPKRTPIFNTN